MKLLLAMGFVGVTLLTGCAATPPVVVQTNGDFTSLDKTATEYISSDAVTQLKELYPPASTKFELHQNTADNFGVAFVSGIRSAGYGLYELMLDETGSVPVGDGLKLEYTIDSLEANTVYLSILIDSQSISRSYITKNGTAAPTSAWNIKE
jgi:hypothetical protein